MKILSYSIFGEQNYTDRNRFVFDKYLLGVYFNARMNRLIYPEWEMWLHTNFQVYYKHREYLSDLTDLTGAVVSVSENIPAKCEGMLWRFKPIYTFRNGESKVLCRDLDSLTSYREAQYVQSWLDSGKGFHSIHDNPAHSGLMGGLIGIDVKQFHDTFPEYDTFDKLIADFNLDTHGTDQNLLNKRLMPKIGNNLHTSFDQKTDLPNLANVPHKLWESDLCINFIGAAGVNEMETLRFFQRFDDDEKYHEFEKKHSNICYWKR